MSHEEEKEGTVQEGTVHIGHIGRDLSGNVTGSGDITTSGDTLIEAKIGDISGSNVNLGSTLTHVTQQVGALAGASPDDRAELEKLLKQLEAALEKVPAEKQEEAETVAELTQELVGEAGQAKPKKRKLQITGEGLKQAAQDLAGVAPLVGTIAVEIVKKILTLSS